ncbi:MAG: endoribonuclease MazF [Bacteroidetes bacterium]|nr:endoribonuclease MazF [Bacteroidota bacterium]
MAGYIPERGDLVWLNFGPHVGHKQKGKRPGLVLSPREYNGKSGLAVLCPITSQIKGYPFEVRVKSKGISGVVLADHIKSLDWDVREIEYVGTVRPSIVSEVQEKLQALLF